MKQLVLNLGGSSILDFNSVNGNLINLSPIPTGIKAFDRFEVLKGGLRYGTINIIHGKAENGVNALAETLQKNMNPDYVYFNNVMFDSLRWDYYTKVVVFGYCDFRNFELTDLEGLHGQIFHRNICLVLVGDFYQLTNYSHKRGLLYKSSVIIDCKENGSIDSPQCVFAKNRYGAFDSKPIEFRYNFNGTNYYLEEIG